MEGLGQPKVSEIKRIVAREYGVTVADLEGQSRRRDYARPRQVAMYLSRRLTNYSYPHIGRLFGGRDHTTVLFAYRRTIERIAASEETAGAVSLLRGMIEAEAARRPVFVSHQPLLKPISIRAAFNMDQFAWRSLPGQLEVAA